MQTTLSDVAKGLSRSLRRSLKELPRSLVTENSASQARGAGMRIEALSNCQIARSLKELERQALAMGAGNEPPPRPAESSVSSDHPPREQSDDADMGDPESDRGGDPESRLGRKEKQRESGSKSMMFKRAMNGWRPKRNGCEFTVVPDEICSFRTTFRTDLS